MSEMMLTAWNDEVRRTALRYVVQATIKFMIMLLLQESHMDDDSKLAGETITVFVEDEEGHERILRHDNGFVCPTIII